MRRDDLPLPEPPATDRPGDRWMCGRGGDSPCSRGPTIEGTCPLADACVPRRTWHGHRKRIATIAGFAITVVVVAITWIQADATVMKPGELSTPHAQILAGTLASQRCASCHPQAATSVAGWFVSAGSGHEKVTQSDRCLDCHHASIERSTAMLAHNLPAQLLANLKLASVTTADHTWHDVLPGPAVDQQNVQCSACHREHHGADGNLLDVSDFQCQTCHADRFGSFATSHPDWDRWPYGRDRTLAFNHYTHATKHFPATKMGLAVAPFQCAECHPRNADGELARSASYEKSCSTCHDEALRLETAEGFDLIALPMLPPESAERIAPWPDAATGFYDGALSPLTDLLLRFDPDAASAIRRLPKRDFARIDTHDPDAVTAGETIARACRHLLRDISANGQQAIVDRTAAMGITLSSVSPLIRSLSPQLIEETRDRWFGPSIDEVDLIRPTQYQEITDPPSSLLVTDETTDTDLLLVPDDDGGDDLLALPGDSAAEGDPLGGDPLTLDPLAQPIQAESTLPDGFDAGRLLPAGGWYRDDTRMAIRYRGGGHDDPVLKSAIDLISQLPPGDPARTSMLKNRAVAACVDCHPGALTLGDGRWRSDPLIGSRGEFTRFSHGPHLNIATLADCRHCHRVGDTTSPIMLASSGSRPVHEFAPMTRQSCAACHTPEAAGDSCVKCHRYHIDLR